jgi:hypothetical protein
MMRFAFFGIKPLTQRLGQSLHEIDFRAMRSQLEQLLLAISSNAFLQGERTVLIFDRYGLISAFVRGPD